MSDNKITGDRLSPSDPVLELMRITLANAMSKIMALKNEKPDAIKYHVWRDSMYTGDIDGRPVVWIGWSLNLSEEIQDFKTVYVDLVPNNLRSEQRLDLYGETMTELVVGIERFIIAFITGFSREDIAQINQLGFTARLAGPRAVHACLITTTIEFTETSLNDFSNRLADLIQFGIAYTHNKKRN